MIVNPVVSERDALSTGGTLTIDAEARRTDAELGRGANRERL